MKKTVKLSIMILLSFVWSISGGSTGKTSPAGLFVWMVDHAKRAAGGITHIKE